MRPIKKSKSLLVFIFGAAIKTGIPGINKPMCCGPQTKDARSCTRAVGYTVSIDITPTKLTRLVLVLLTLVVLFVAPGFGSAQPANKTFLPASPAGTAAVPNVSPSAPPPNPAVAISTNGSGTPTNLSGYVPDDKYKLRGGDKISLQTIEDRDL